MRSKKRVYMIALCVIFLCAVFMMVGCSAKAGEETELINISEKDVEETDENEPDYDTEKENVRTGDAEDENDVIYVDVCGQVKTPGVYQLQTESRVYEAIEKAGGMTKKAAVSYLNQAEKLEDGQQIYVPSEEEIQRGQLNMVNSGNQPEGNLKENSSGDGKINLNTATKEELMTLSGIGEVKAEAIIRYRQEQGAFQSVEDVKKIEGIKEGVFNKIKNQIKV